MRRGLSQVRLAIAIGRSESWLSQVERGERFVDRLSILGKIADVLNIPVTVLTGDPPAITEPHTAEHVAVVAIRNLLSGHDFLYHVLRPELRFQMEPDQLLMQDRFRRYWEFAHASRYGAASDLAAIIGDAENVARICAEDQQPEAFRHIAIGYQAAAAIMAKLGQTDIAWVAADRSILAAERSSEPMLAIAGEFRLGHAFLSGGRPDQAMYAAESGLKAVAHALAEGSDEAVSLWGALSLVQAIALARKGDEPGARKALDTAREAATKLGYDGNVYDTEFGPTNVQVHAVALAVELGHPTEALRLSEDLDPTPLSLERRGRFLIDVARAYGQKRDTAGAVRTLMETEQLTPEQVANHWAVRELVRDLLRRERTRPNRKLRDFAEKIGLI